MDALKVSVAVADMSMTVEGPPADVRTYVTEFYEMTQRRQNAALQHYVMAAQRKGTEQ